MRGFFIACLLLLSSPAAADLPALFDVQGVASDDVLNVRQEPSANSEIIGGLTPDARSIEVIRYSNDDRWALINFGEASAWVATQFLQRSSRLDLIPEPMQCYGTEPFWSLRISWPGSASVVDFSLAGEIDKSFVVHSADAFNGRSVIMAGPDNNEDVHLLAAVNPQYCDDGMSDREFGLRVELFLLNRGDWQSYTGCCSLAP